VPGISLAVSWAFLSRGIRGLTSCCAGDRIPSPFLGCEPNLSASAHAIHLVRDSIPGKTGIFEHDCFQRTAWERRITSILCSSIAFTSPPSVGHMRCHCASHVPRVRRRDCRRANLGKSGRSLESQLDDSLSEKTTVHGTTEVFGGSFAESVGTGATI